MLKSVSGSKEVVSVSTVEYKKDVYNLVLSDVSLMDKFDRTETIETKDGTLGWRFKLRKMNPFLNLTGKQHTFYANGVVSGDTVVQMGLQN